MFSNMSDKSRFTHVGQYVKVLFKYETVGGVVTKLPYFCEDCFDTVVEVKLDDGVTVTPVIDIVSTRL